MEQRNEIEKRVEETLSSLDGIQRAEPGPWLFSRVQRRLMREEDKTVWGTIGSFLSRPAVAIAGLCIILMLNTFFLVKQGKETSSTLSQNEQQALDSESLIASSSSFDYETFVQP